MKNSVKPIFKALFDTNALTIILGDILRKRRGSEPRYNNVSFAIDRGFFRIYLPPTVLHEIHGRTDKNDQRISLLRELIEKRIIVEINNVNCCSSKIFRECIKDLERFLRTRDPVDYEIVKEYFGYIELSTSQSRTEEIPFLFITENVRDFSTNVASTITRCVINYVSLELQRYGYAAPAGVYNLEWLDHHIGKILENIANRLE